MLYKGTYLSNDDLARDEAQGLGYDNVGSHPRHVGVPEVGELLVIDIDGVLFDDRAESIEKAIEHARRGVRVGIHTYASNDERLAPAHAEPSIKIAKTHREVLEALGCRLPDEPSACVEASSEEDDLQFWLEAAQAEIDAAQGVEPACSLPFGKEK